MSQWEWKQKLSKEIFFMKYDLHGENSVSAVFNNIAKEVASCENIKIQENIQKQFYDIMINKKFIPAGRILANARPNSKMKNYNNCFTIQLEDSMDGIYEALKEDAQISKMGGGVGFNISHLRPKDAIISKGGESSGPISFLKVFDASAKTIHTGGGRRCLPATYTVQMFDKSWKKITEIVVGDQILFENNSYKVNEFYDNGEQELIKIKSKKGWHISTPNHKWLVLNLKTNNPEWVEAQNLYKDEIKFAFLRPKNDSF